MSRRAYVRMSGSFVPTKTHARSNSSHAEPRFTGNGHFYAVAQDHELFRGCGYLHLESVGT